MTEPTPTIESLQARIVVLESDRRTRGYRLLLLWASVIAALALGVTWVNIQNNHSIARERTARVASQRAFCGIIILLDDSYRHTPPSTQAGRQLASAISTARIVNSCPPPKGA
jgi:hypothetical protein